MWKICCYGQLCRSVWLVVQIHCHSQFFFINKLWIIFQFLPVMNVMFVLLGCDALYFSLVDGYYWFRGLQLLSPSLRFKWPWGWDSRSLRNVANLLPDYRTLQPTRQQSQQILYKHNKKTQINTKRGKRLWCWNTCVKRRLPRSTANYTHYWYNKILMCDIVLLYSN
jgi:hypothetical protein